MKALDPKEFAKKIPMPAQSLQPKPERLALLLRWSRLVRQSPLKLYMFHRMEYWNEAQLRTSLLEYGASTALHIAVHDPMFQSLGLGPTSRDVMEFFELKPAELHQFSCDCGGSIDNDVMANRIVDIANGHTGFWGRLRRLVGL